MLAVSIAVGPEISITPAVTPPARLALRSAVAPPVFDNSWTSI